MWIILRTAADVFRITWATFWGSWDSGCGVFALVEGCFSEPTWLSGEVIGVAGGSKVAARLPARQNSIPALSKSPFQTANHPMRDPGEIASLNSPRACHYRMALTSTTKG